MSKLLNAIEVFMANATKEEILELREEAPALEALGVNVSVAIIAGLLTLLSRIEENRDAWRARAERLNDSIVDQLDETEQV